MSTHSQIVAFLRFAGSGLAPDTLAKAIRRRWPEVGEEEIRQAIAQAATEEPTDGEEQAALDAASGAMLRG